MTNLFLRVVVNGFALWLVAQIIEGITLSGNVINWLLVAVVFGLVNAIIRPLVKLVTLPVNVATLGLFSLVINALMLLLTAFVTDALAVDGFLPALFGSILIGIVSTILSWFLKDDS